MANSSRRYSASDVRRYARCPRQWWYEARRDDLAALTPAELERRMAALRRRHGAGAENLPAYLLLADLAARQEQMAHGRAAHRAHAARVSRRGAGCFLPFAGLLVVALCLTLALTRAPLDTA